MRPSVLPFSPLRCTSAIALAALLGFAGPAAAQTAAAPASAASVPGPALETLKDKTSYATGVMTARQLIKNEVPFDIDLLVLGLRDGLAGGEIRISEKDLKLVLQSMQADIMRKMSNDRMIKSNVNREKGLIFQTDYRKKPDVTVLPGNLMYRVIKDAKGDKPGDLSTVVVRYSGRLIDGSVFEATPEGKTSTLKLTEVITGLREAIKHMPAGATFEVVVPPTLAYAARGSATVGPNETLVFTVELVAVVQ